MNFKKWLGSYLDAENPLPQADVMIIEGWIPEYHYTVIPDYLRGGMYKSILVTGNYGRVNLVELCNASDLTIKNIEYAIPGELNKFKIYLKSYYSGSDFPVVEIFKNEKLVSSCGVNEKTIVEFESVWNTEDSLLIRFTNGTLFPAEPDKIVRITNLRVNSRFSSIFHSTLFLQRQESSSPINTNTREERLSNYLRMRGFVQVYTLSSSRQGISKTYNAASDALEWLKSNGYTSANILTSDKHSRRTYLSYKKADPDFSVGVVTIDSKWPPSKRVILKELTGIFVVKFFPRSKLSEKSNGIGRLKRMPYRIYKRIKKLN